MAAGYALAVYLGHARPAIQVNLGRRNRSTLKSSPPSGADTEESSSTDSESHTDSESDDATEDAADVAPESPARELPEQVPQLDVADLMPGEEQAASNDEAESGDAVGEETDGEKADASEEAGEAPVEEVGRSESPEEASDATTSAEPVPVDATDTPAQNDAGLTTETDAAPNPAIANEAPSEGSAVAAETTVATEPAAPAQVEGSTASDDADSAESSAKPDDLAEEASASDDERSAREEPTVDAPANDLDSLAQMLKSASASSEHADEDTDEKSDLATSESSEVADLPQEHEPEVSAAAEAGGGQSAIPETAVSAESESTEEAADTAEEGEQHTSADSTTNERSASEETGEVQQQMGADGDPPTEASAGDQSLSREPAEKAQDIASSEDRSANDDHGEQTVKSQESEILQGLEAFQAQLSEQQSIEPEQEPNDLSDVSALQNAETPQAPPQETEGLSEDSEASSDVPEQAILDSIEAFQAQLEQHRSGDIGVETQTEKDVDVPSSLGAVPRQQEQPDAEEDVDLADQAALEGIEAFQSQLTQQRTATSEQAVDEIAVDDDTVAPEILSGIDAFRSQLAEMKNSPPPVQAESEEIGSQAST